MITVERTGPLALIEDLGRPGLAHLGVTGSGAADREALRLGNRLVGNPEGAAAIEITLGGLTVSTDRPVWCAVTGPWVDVGCDDRVVGSHRSLLLRPGQRLSVGVPRRGLRNYLSVRGGLEPAPTLGSTSTDVLSGLGPAPLRRGDRLPVGVPTEPLPATSFASPPEPVGDRGVEPATELAITPGPRQDWFDAETWALLLGTRWQVSADSNRVGIRLTGASLTRRVEDELPSEGLLAGAIQVPASGEPVIFGPDHPVTGGYPVIAVLTEASCDAAGQLRGGDTVWLVSRRVTRSAQSWG